MKRLKVMQSFIHEDSAEAFNCDVFTAAKIGLSNAVQMPGSGRTSSLADKISSNLSAHTVVTY